MNTAVTQFYEFLNGNLDLPGCVYLREFFYKPEIKERWSTAPASTALRFHHAHEGGLAEHTLEVILVMKQLATVLKGVTLRGIDILMVGALHDVHKIGDALGHPNYVPNYLKEGKLSEKVPFVTNAASMKYTHIPDIGGRDPAWRQTSYLATHCAEDVPEGDLSLSLVYAVHPPLYEALNDDVKFAIRFHDGAYGIARRKLVNNETPLQMILHFADMWSSKAGHKPE